MEYLDESGAVKQARVKAVAMGDITDHWPTWSRNNISRVGELKLVAISGGWS